MNRTTITKTLRAKLPELKKEFPIKKLGIFGSFARGEQTPKSDIDILVEFNGPIGLFGFVKLQHRLARTLHRKVDLVSKKGLKRIIKKDILNEVRYV